MQVVNEARVTAHDQLLGEINKGYLLLVGFTHGDDMPLVKKMTEKLLSLRLFPDENGATNLSLSDIKGEILSVSQFTLYGSLKKGRRPSFTNSLPGSESKQLYDYFNQCLKELHGPIQTGEFGADMQVSLVNNGPFTILLDSEELYG